MLSSALRNTVLTAVATCLAHAQIEVHSGTKITCRLEQTLSSATAGEGQPVQLTVTENVYVGNTLVSPQGSAVSGTIISAMPKRRIGPTGKLDFSIDKVRALDGQYIPVRYTINRRTGRQHARPHAMTAAFFLVDDGQGCDCESRPHGGCVCRSGPKRRHRGRSRWWTPSPVTPRCRAWPAASPR
ncbi:MAG: TrbI/VirB10 family protein [Acidobacteria bacterium]|nr:TrbI/VirB10 family protein [Acidobacteriota bacterium]